MSDFPDLDTLPPLPDSPSLLILPPEIHHRLASFLLDSTSALTLVLTHPTLRELFEEHLWSKLNLTLPPFHGEPVLTFKSPASSKYVLNSSMIHYDRQKAIRNRIRGLLPILSRPEKSRAKLVKSLTLEPGQGTAEETVQLLESLPRLQSIIITPFSRAAAPRDNVGAIGSDLLQPFYTELLYSTARFECLTTLDIHHPEADYRLNLMGFLESTPQLRSLIIKGGDAVVATHTSTFIPRLPKLEYLSVTGPRLDPLDFVLDILPGSPDLQTLEIRDTSYRAMERGLASWELPPTYSPEGYGEVLKKHKGLREIKWDFKGWSMEKVVGVKGGFESVEDLVKRSGCASESMERLEFVDIPAYTSLRQLKILPSSLPTIPGHSQPQQSMIQPPLSYAGPEGDLSRLVKRIQAAPELTDVYFGNGRLGGVPPPYWIEKRCPKAMIRSYVGDGELIHVRMKSRSVEREAHKTKKKGKERAKIDVVEDESLSDSGGRGGEDVADDDNVIHLGTELDSSNHAGPSFIKYGNPSIPSVASDESVADTYPSVVDSSNSSMIGPKALSVAPNDTSDCSLLPPANASSQVPAATAPVMSAAPSAISAAPSTPVASSTPPSQSTPTSAAAHPTPAPVPAPIPQLAEPYPTQPYAIHTHSMFPTTKLIYLDINNLVTSRTFTATTRSSRSQDVKPGGKPVWTHTAWYNSLPLPYSVLEAAYNGARLKIRWDDPGRGMTFGGLGDGGWEILKMWEEGKKVKVEERRVAAEGILADMERKERGKKLEEMEEVVGVRTKKEVDKGDKDSSTEEKGKSSRGKREVVASVVAVDDEGARSDDASGGETQEESARDAEKLEEPGWVVVPLVPVYA